jgi:hypothetical protein
MVLYSIPNLNESFSMEYSIPQIKDSIALIPLFDKKYRISLPDECPNRVTLESKEFLNSAVFVDFNLATIQENKTDVTLEIRRKKRSFDQHYEVTNAFIHIDKLIEQLSKAILLNDTEIQKLKESQKVFEKQTLKKPKKQVLESINRLWSF